MKLQVAAMLVASASASLVAQNAQMARGNPAGEWRYWGADAYSTRYSPLDQINAKNFDSLQIAWQWSAASLGPDEYFRSTPLYANGRLFTVATERRVAAAIDPENGQTLWMRRIDEGIRWQKAPRRYSGRGLAYWTDGTNERVVVVTPGYHLISLDAKTGDFDPNFGDHGVVDLMEGLGIPLVPLAVDDSGPLIISDAAPYREARPGETWDPVKKIGADGTKGILGQIGNSSPAIIVGDVIVVGNSHIHGYFPIRLVNNRSYIRGFDIHTGKQLWKFNLIPEPGEYGADTWERGTGPGAQSVAKVDAWAPYSADPELGLVYIPVGMPLMDEYGGYRPGANLFSSSIVALDARTGQRRWHYQLVHHDIWDYDTPMAPTLIDVTVDGKPRKAIAATTKQGFVYTFDRATGEPIWPIVETKVAASEIPSEKAYPTQPIPTKPAPYTQQGLQASDLIDYTPAIRDSALKLAKRCRMGPYFIPGSDATTNIKGAYKCSWYTPGASGGVNIDGGPAFDPETGMYYVASITGLSTIQLQKDPCSEFILSSRHDSCGLIGALPTPAGYVRQAGLSADGFSDRDALAKIGGVSILKPKQFGGITAYDMNTGEKKWWIPNGGYNKVTSNDPLFKGVALPPDPAQGQAQVINTKTLVIYGTGRQGGTRGAPAQLFAVDKATGKQVGAVRIPSRTTAVPMTFMHNGKQYIVFAVGQGSSTSLVALTLPR
ncbi:MAG TPA: PQQ-binding-like beta-propeller repeat protein [Gemmatimonadaceae bacterium]|nr:PQQ-binding-like beta-propeller repeat protein [Gemmatimonadaceae bacterium]